MTFPLLVRVTVAAVLVGVLIWIGRPYVSYNLWSIRVSRAAHGPGLQTVDFGGEPAGFPRGTIWKGMAALQRNDPLSALDLLNQAPPGPTPDPIILALRGRAEAALGRPQLAAQDWVAAGARWEIIAAATKAMDERRWSDALTILDVASVPFAEDVVEYSARALSGEGKTSDAIASIRQALDRWPASSYREAWLLDLGDYSGSVGNWSDAAVAYAQATQVTRGAFLWLAYIRLGQATYEQHGSLKLATDYVQKGIGLNSDAPTGYVVLGDMALSDNRAGDAEALYRSAYTRAPDNVFVVEKMVDLFLANDEGGKAQELLQTSIGRSPKEPHLYYLQSLVFEKMGDGKGAVASIERSIELTGARDARYLVAAGDLYERQQKPEQARQSYEAALVIDPQNKTAMAGFSRTEGAKP